MIYGYARVSTVKQMKNGNSLEEQEKALRDAGAEKIITEAYTGTKVERPSFTALLEELKPGDKLIVTKLDRFARTAAEGAQIVQELLQRGVTVHILNMGRVDDSPIGRLLVQVLLSFAEFERSQIIERTQAGRHIAMANGQKMGRPQKYSTEKINLAMKLLDDGNSYNQVERMTGISKSTLIRRRKR